jgi:hypothetical protein
MLDFSRRIWPICTAVSCRLGVMASWAPLRRRATTYQLVGLLQRPLCFANGRLARLARRLFDLLELLGEICLHQLQLGLVAAKAFGAGIRVDEVRHAAVGYGQCNEIVVS